MNLRPNINSENIPESFKKWFKENKFDLIWNEQAKGYDSNENINIFNLGLSFIPIQFNIVKGNFSCSFNYFISLEGCPKEVGGNFNCSDNNLTSLKGSLKEVKGDFDCSHNQLESLEGCPKKVRGHFDCYNNQLISLNNCPKEIKERFDCVDNNLDINEFIKINCNNFFL